MMTSLKYIRRQNTSFYFKLSCKVYRLLLQSFISTSRFSKVIQGRDGGICPTLESQTSSLNRVRGGSIADIVLTISVQFCPSYLINAIRFEVESFGSIWI